MTKAKVEGWHERQKVDIEIRVYLQKNDRWLDFHALMQFCSLA